MRYYLSPVLFVILCLIYGCKSSSKEKFCPNKTEILKGDSEEEILLDLELPKSLLLESIQSQTKTDLCSNPILNAKMNFFNEIYKFSVFIFKDCKYSTDHMPTIRIYLDNHEVVINNHSVNVMESNFVNLMETLTKEIQDITSTREIVYLLEWNITIDTNVLKSRIVQVLEGITNYSEYISIKEFNRSICEIDNKRLGQIDAMFHGVIGFAGTSSNIKMDVPHYPKD